MNFPDRDQEHCLRGESPLAAVSANTLARYLGVTPKEVYDLAKAGIIERGSGRLYRSKIVYGVTVITSAGERHDEARRIAANIAKPPFARQDVRAADARKIY